MSKKVSTRYQKSLTVLDKKMARLISKKDRNIFSEKELNSFETKLKAALKRDKNHVVKHFTAQVHPQTKDLKQPIVEAIREMGFSVLPRAVYLIAPPGVSDPAVGNSARHAHLVLGTDSKNEYRV